MDLENRVAVLESQLQRAKRSKRLLGSLLFVGLVLAGLGAAQLPRTFLVNVPLQIVDDKGVPKISLDQNGNAEFTGDVRVKSLDIQSGILVQNRVTKTVSETFKLYGPKAAIPNGAVNPIKFVAANDFQRLIFNNAMGQDQIGNKKVVRIWLAPSTNWNQISQISGGFGLRVGSTGYVEIGGDNIPPNLDAAVVVFVEFEL